MFLSRVNETYDLMVRMGLNKSAEYLREKDLHCNPFNEKIINYSMGSVILDEEFKEETPLEAILSRWSEEASLPGAYYCGLTEFKTIYQHEARSLLRSGSSAYVISFETENEPDEENESIMQQLGNVISINLRMGDLYTCASPKHYIALLKNISHSNCEALVGRILNSMDTGIQPNITKATITPVIPVS